MNELRQLIVAVVPDIIFLCETKIHVNEFDRIRRKCKMEGCFVVDSVGRKGGLAILWKDSFDVQVQSYSQNHIDTIIKRGGLDKIRFTGFYGHSEPNLCHLSWDCLRNIGKHVKEDWVLGGDFNEILEENEKNEGRRKPISAWLSLGKWWVSWLYWISNPTKDGIRGQTIEGGTVW